VSPRLARCKLAERLLKGGTTVNLTVLFRTVFCFYMKEGDTQRPWSETLAMGLLGELNTNGSCNIRMLSEVYAKLESSSPYRSALKEAVKKSKLPNKEYTIAGKGDGLMIKSN